MTGGPHEGGSWLGRELAQRRLSLWRASGGALAARLAGRRRPASVAGATRLAPRREAPPPAEQAPAPPPVAGITDAAARWLFLGEYPTDAQPFLGGVASSDLSSPPRARPGSSGRVRRGRIEEGPAVARAQATPAEAAGRGELPPTASSAPHADTPADDRTPVKPQAPVHEPARTSRPGMERPGPAPAPTSRPDSQRPGPELARISRPAPERPGPAPTPISRPEPERPGPAPAPISRPGSERPGPAPASISRPVGTARPRANADLPARPERPDPAPIPISRPDAESPPPGAKPSPSEPLLLRQPDTAPPTDRVRPAGPPRPDTQPVRSRPSTAPATPPRRDGEPHDGPAAAAAPPPSPGAAGPPGTANPIPGPEPARMSRLARAPATEGRPGPPQHPRRPTSRPLPQVPADARDESASESTPAPLAHGRTEQQPGARSPVVSQGGERPEPVTEAARTVQRTPETVHGTVPGGQSAAADTAIPDETAQSQPGPAPRRRSVDH